MAIRSIIRKCFGLGPCYGFAGALACALALAPFAAHATTIDP